MPYVYCEVAGWAMPNCNWSTVQWLSQNLRMPLAPGGVSPMHRTGNALKVFCVAAVGKTCTVYSTDKPSITQIVEEADENLFNSIRYNTSHLLHQLLPRRTESRYSLRSRPHNFELSHIHDDTMLFTLRRYASAGNSDRNASVRPSVRLSVCPSVCHAPVLFQNEES